MRPFIYIGNVIAVEFVNLRGICSFYCFFGGGGRFAARIVNVKGWFFELRRVKMVSVANINHLRLATIPASHKR